ncbi:MAG TPA: pyridoxal-phosphate dependent enzyme [Candidatus Dormibacteraeota bacterium]|nr:pyridoxal-phosphate dependent enzyme [Candidatus Dormibacteraeota bacterium]
MGTPAGFLDSSISVERIAEAARVIEPTFLNSPQFVCEPLGSNVLLKVETVNPIRSFKGRGTEYLLHRLDGAGDGLVCASAGNFGQGMAYACRKRGVGLTVYASDAASALKIERMRALGATVVLVPGDFDAAKDAARNHPGLFIEDGLLGAIAEGAGTIGIELAAEALDAVFVPLGNGSLVNGVGTWLKHRSPQTRVVAVCAEGAPSMALSWKAHAAVTAPSDTIADGIAVRVPVPDAVRIMETTVDDVMLVSDGEMRDAMRSLFYEAGLLVEPAGAAGVAAIKKARPEGRVAAILTGGNLTEQQFRDWIY